MKLRKILCSLLIALAGVLCGANLLAETINQPPSGTPDAIDQSQAKTRELFQQAMALASEAGHAATQAESTALRQRAIDMFHYVTQQQPDFENAYRAEAACLLDQAKTFQNAPQRRTYVKTALERGAAASQCSSAEWNDIQLWANNLIEEMATLAPDVADRRVVLDAARQSYERCLQKTSFARQRPPIELELANCLWLLVNMTTEPAAKRALYEQIIASINAAATAKPDLITGPVEIVWGGACVELGKQTKDVGMLRQAVEHLERGVKETQDFGDARYNLACTYAVLGEREAALRHLRLCLEHDRGLIRETAATDPDLASLRTTTEFAELLKPEQLELDSVAIFRKGQISQQQAEDAHTASAALRYYTEAIEFYARAVEIQPDFVQAHALWAECLFGMARRTADPQEHQKIVTAALAQFDAAVLCKKVTAQVYYLAGTDVFKEATQQGGALWQQRALLQTARSYFEAGIRLAKEGSDRRALEQPLALCLTSLGNLTTDLKEKRELSKQVIGLCESIAPAPEEQMDTKVLAAWGVALVELGKIDRDPAMLRRGIERLLTVVERKTDALDERYNLACAYALLNQPDQAVRHLRACWEKDSDEVYHKQSKNDRDLQSIRGSPAYKKLLADYALPAPEPPKEE